MYLGTKWHTSKCSESSLIAIKPKPKENIRKSAVLLFYLNRHFPTDAIQDPAKVGINCINGQTYSEVGLKSKRRYTGNWSAAAWRPSRVIAQQYSPATTASLCSHTRKKKCGCVSKFDFISYCFLNSVGWRFYSVRKHINKSLYFRAVRYSTLRHFIVLIK
jgi:hypothetical protein